MKNLYCNLIGLIYIDLILFNFRIILLSFISYISYIYFISFYFISLEWPDLLALEIIKVVNLPPI